MSTALTQQEFQQAVRRLLVLATMADGEIDPEEVQTLIEVHRRLTGASIDESDLLDEIGAIQAGPIGLGPYLRGLAPRLDWDRKSQLLEAVMLVTTADQAVQDPERDLVEVVAGALTADPDELERLVLSVRNRL